MILLNVLFTWTLILLIDLSELPSCALMCLPGSVSGQCSTPPVSPPSARPPPITNWHQDSSVLRNKTQRILAPLSDQLCVTGGDRPWPAWFHHLTSNFHPVVYFGLSHYRSHHPLLHTLMRYIETPFSSWANNVVNVAIDKRNYSAKVDIFYVSFQSTFIFPLW